MAQRFARRILRPQADAECYLRKSLSGKELKELRRKERRLAELGQVELRTLSPNGDLHVWVEDFLQLEASGWKGCKGSAMGINPVNRDFFQTVATEAYWRKKLWMNGLFLNDKPIAMKCTFLTSSGLFAFKIAFDEEFGGVSPGYLLEVATIREMHQRSDIQWIDSCTSYKPTMFDRLWLDQRVMQTLLLPTGGFSSHLVVSFLKLLRWLKHRVKKCSAK